MEHGSTAKANGPRQCTLNTKDRACGKGLGGRLMHRTRDLRTRTCPRGCAGASLGCRGTPPDNLRGLHQRTADHNGGNGSTARARRAIPLQSATSPDFAGFMASFRASTRDWADGGILPGPSAPALMVLVPTYSATPPPPLPRKRRNEWRHYSQTRPNQSSGKTRASPPKTTSHAAAGDTPTNGKSWPGARAARARRTHGVAQAHTRMDTRQTPPHTRTVASQERARVHGNRRVRDPCCWAGSGGGWQRMPR